MPEARVRTKSGSNGVNMIEVTVLQTAFQPFLNRASAFPSRCQVAGEWRGYARRSSYDSVLQKIITSAVG